MRRAVLRRIDGDPTAPVSQEGTVLDDALAELTDERSVLTRGAAGRPGRDLRLITCGVRERVRD